MRDKNITDREYWTKFIFWFIFGLVGGPIILGLIIYLGFYIIELIG